MELTDTYKGQRIGDRVGRADAAGIEVASSFAELYARSRDDVYRAVLLTVRDPHRAEDSVQEAFARAFADWDRIRLHPNPVGWVARVALNDATSLWRRLRRESTEPPPGLVAPADEQSIDPFLLRAVWRLPRRQRQVVALRILLDQSIDQTAQALGMAPGTVRAHLHRALRSLHERLRDAGHDTEESHHG